MKTMTIDATDIERFRSLVAERLGLSFEDDKLDFLADILHQRMERTKCDQFSSYERHIRSGIHESEELRAIAEELTVCETYFFRYAGHFRAFTETVIPDRTRARTHHRKIRILSAGCASGEEAYSLAILIRDRLPELASWEITICGIDVNASMLKKALRCRYTTWSLRETPADLRTKYFHDDGRDFLLDNSIRSSVTFEERNLAEEDPGFWQRDAFDIVFCRNVTMYFTPETARSVITRIAKSLTPGGFLFLGHAETLRGISQEFHLRHTHETFYYQRKDSQPNHDDIFPQASAGNGSSQLPISTVFEPNVSWFDTIHRASERIVNLTEGKSRAATEPEKAAAKRSDFQASARSACDGASAIELLRKERFTEAMELVRALPAESKADPNTQLLLAVLLTNKGDLQEAEKVCENLLKLDELNAGAHYLMALCREHASDLEAAMKHDRAAVYLDSTFAMPHLHLGLIARRSSQIETANLELNHALTLLAREDPSRILFFGGGFTRESLVDFCHAELRACGENG